MTISRNMLQTLSFGAILLIIILIAAFMLLIPKGKEYRGDRIEKRKSKMVVNKYQAWHNGIATNLKSLQTKNKNILSAYEYQFNPERFKTLYESYFQNLELSQVKDVNISSDFNIYEVKATSSISSPTIFYDFLDAVNKGEWIISIDFPIEFDRSAESIKTSFKMRVYSDSN
ncbi:MAG: hypothetical protein GQ570_06765 [Helicobacteraceae bacterium]|nr:hypothetical protein [Helicobacteraceae bacterium]